MPCPLLTKLKIVCIFAVLNSKIGRIMGNNAIILASSLSRAIRDKYFNLCLEFVELNKKTNMAYSADLSLEGIKYIDDQRCVFYGQLDLAGKPWGVATIEYRFATKEFYRVYYTEKTMRRRKFDISLSLIVHNIDEVNALLEFIIQYKNSEEGSL